MVPTWVVFWNEGDPFELKESLCSGAPFFKEFKNVQFKCVSSAEC